MGEELSFICVEIGHDADDLNDWNFSSRTLTWSELNSNTLISTAVIATNANNAPKSKSKDKRSTSKSVGSSTEIQKRPKRPSKKTEREDVSSFSSRLLLFEDVADLVIKNLSKPDLLNARRVCRLWNKIALKEMKNFYWWTTELDYDNYKEFNKCFRDSKNKWIFHNLKFENWQAFKSFYGHIFNQPVSQNEFHIKGLYLTLDPINVTSFRNNFLQMLSKFSSQMEVLELELCNLSSLTMDILLKADLRFPKLRILNFTPSCSDNFPAIFEKITSSTPQLSIVGLNFQYASDVNRITCSQYFWGLSMVAPNLTRLILNFDKGDILTNNFGTVLLLLAKENGLTQLKDLCFWIEDNKDDGVYYETFDEIKNFTKFLNYQRNNLESLSLSIRTNFVVNFHEVSNFEKVSLLPRLPKLKELVYFCQLRSYSRNEDAKYERIFNIFSPIDVNLLFTSEFKRLAILGFPQVDPEEMSGFVWIKNYPPIISGNSEFWTEIDLNYDYGTLEFLETEI